tara:strand:- start:130 stop:423 length:294 start_codon:yes stop_codon:yes gene_type:complete
MNNKKQTYNKDGSIRKSGSGRKKGANSFVRVTFEELSDFIGAKTPMLVSRVWLENLGLSDMGESQEPISKRKPKLDLTKEEESDKILFSLNKFEDDE